MTIAIRVLVVEDDKLIQLLVQEALAEGGFEVSTTSTGERAIIMLEADGADYQALITDVNLADEVTGWAVAARAREINDALPVIYMTGDGAHDWASKGVPNSVLLTKPFAPAQIITAVSQLLNAAPGRTG